MWKKAAGGILTAKQVPRRPGTAPALGPRRAIASSFCLRSKQRSS